MIRRTKRRFFQIGTLVVSNSYVGSILYNNIYQGWFKGICVPVMNCYGCPLAVMSCPIGTLQHFVIIKAIPFMLIGFLGTIGLVVGRMTCGWLCPFGFFQEMLYKIKTRKLYPRKVFNYTKYVILIGLTLLVAYWVGEPWFCKLCPVGSLEASVPLSLWNPSGDIFTQGGSVVSRAGVLFFTKILILGAVVTAAIFVYQPFCRYACPLGAIWSMFNRFSLFQMKTCDDTCELGEECREECPMDIYVHKTPNAGDCTRCLECTKCENVRFQLAWSKDRLRSGRLRPSSESEQKREGGR
ncbi:MAG: 4Fe-4S binding protein [Candidatus Zixiibacteriota bacterium]